MNIINLIYKDEFSIGIVLFLSSLVYILSSKLENFYLLSFIVLINWISIMLIVDYLNRKINNESFFPNTKYRLKKDFKMFVVAILFCSLLETLGVYFTRGWYYDSKFTLGLYFLAAPTAFFLYTLVLYEIYCIVKRMVSTKKNLSKIKYNKVALKYFMNIAIIIGISGLIFTFIYAIKML